MVLQGPQQVQTESEATAAAQGGGGGSQHTTQTEIHDLSFLRVSLEFFLEMDD